MSYGNIQKRKGKRIIMKFLLCCTLVPTKYEVENKEISNAANRFLTNFCNQLEKGHLLKVLSYIGVSFDGDAKKDLLKVKDERIQYFFKSKDILKGVLSMMLATWRGIKECDYAITYNVVYAWMFTPILTKIRRKKSILILADYSPVESYSSLKSKIYAKTQEYFIGKYDYVIGLSENTKKYLNTKQKFMCMEGGISEEFYDYFKNYKEPDKDNTILMYSGILEKVTGIDLLVEAFLKLNKNNSQLIITGEGSLASWVMEKEKQCRRIHYLGCLPYGEYMEKIQNADVLINPRNMELPENANNFPSKIMEYLATGKMIISTRFPGWERYQDYIEFCDSDVKGLRTSIDKCEYNVTEWTGENYDMNRIFSKNFLWSSRVEMIINFLK